MMVIDAIDQEAFDTFQVEIGYYKLFPWMLENFVTRKDAQQMMMPSNLPFTSTVTVTPGQGVQVAVPAGTGSTNTPGAGTGQGTVQPIYDGGTPHAVSQILKTEINAKKVVGGTATEALRAPIKAITG